MGKNIKVLLIEDNPGDARLIAEMLKEVNPTLFELEGFDRLSTGLKRLAEGGIDVVILDMGLPDSQGLETLRKSQAEAKKVPIVVLTGLADELVGIKAVEEGAQDYLLKGQVDGNLLARSIRYAIERKMVERALIESEDKFRNIAERSFDVIMTLDSEGRFTYISPSARRVSGWEPEEFIGKSFRSILLESDIPKAVQKFNEVMKGTSVEGIELEFEKKNGAIITIEGNASPIIGDGEIVGVQGIFRDITGRKRSEEELLKFKLGIERSDEIIFLTDLDGKITYVNPAFEKIYGFSKEEALGKTPRILKSGLAPPEVYKRFWDTLLAKKVVSGELTNKTKDGRFLNIEGSANPILNVNGDIIGFLAVQRDITERKRIEERLETALKDWQNTFNAISDGVWILDREGCVIQSNKVFERILGINTKDVTGQYCYRTAHRTSEFIDDCPFKRMIQTGMREIFEFEDKERGLWFQVTLDPVFNESGEIINAVHIMRDVTDLKKAEETRFENIQLVLSNKAKSDFLAHMSHELRTPLNSIIGFSELLSQKTVGELNEKQEHYIDNVVNSSKHLLAVINDILDLSRVEAGKIELVFEKISVTEVINDAVTLIKERAMKHSMVIKNDIDPLLEIEADRQRLKQILFNLLSNAVKFNQQESGIITITAKKEDDIARISISDTGIGIKETDMKKLFTEFEQIDSGISRKYEGTGLGLAITKKLVELHGGKIWAESKYGEGSTFTFLIPLVSKKE